MKPSRPALTGDFGLDAARTCHYLSCHEELLAHQDGDEGDGDGRAAGDLVKDSCRTVRAAFLDLHAEWLYLDLTDGLRRSLRLAELAYAAADRFPGLLPTRAQIAAERALPQSRKQGREIDQGIFFSAVLRSPRAGGHLLAAMRLPTPDAERLLPEFARTGRIDLETVSIDRVAGVAHVTVRNERFLNAEDDALVGALETAVDLALLDDGVHVAVLRGGPMSHPRYAGQRVFSAGINLTDLYYGRISFIDFLLRRELGYISKLSRGLAPGSGAPGPHLESGKPWIGAVDTFAIGGGMQILLVVDRVIAESSAYFSLPALNEGIIPGAANLRLARLMGSRGARRTIFWGEPIKASDPDSGLICDQVAEPDGMDAAVASSAARLANPAVPANRGMLRLAEETDDAFRSYLAAYALEQAYRLYSPDLLANLDRNWISRRR